MSVAGMMKGHELFRSLPFEEVERISGFSGSKSMDRGDLVFERGALGLHFFIVVDGRVNLRLPSRDRESNLVVGRMEKGDIFGLSPLLGAERYTTTAQCAEPSTILAVEVKPFRAVLEENAQAGLRIMNVAARAYFARYIETLERFQSILNDISLAG